MATDAAAALLLLLLLLQDGDVRPPEEVVCMHPVRECAATIIVDVIG